MTREYAHLLPPSYPQVLFVTNHERLGSSPIEMLLDLALLWGEVEGGIDAQRALRRKEVTPTIVEAAWQRGLLTRSDLRLALPLAWCSPMRPEPLLGTARWVQLFTAAAYPPPEAPVTIYRGATPEAQRGMSWTTDLERAVWFANHSSAGGKLGYVYRARAEPATVLCRVPRTIVGDLAWEENEVIVDPSLLRIEGYYDPGEW